VGWIDELAIDLASVNVWLQATKPERRYQSDSNQNILRSMGNDHIYDIPFNLRHNIEVHGVIP